MGARSRNGFEETTLLMTTGWKKDR